MHENPLYLSFIIIVFHKINLLLEHLERREKDGVDRGGPAHRYAQAPVHVPPKELDLRDGYRLAFRVHQRITLIDTLDRVDGVCT